MATETKGEKQETREQCAASKPRTGQTKYRIWQRTRKGRKLKQGEQSTQDWHGGKGKMKELWSRKWKKQLKESQARGSIKGWTTTFLVHREVKPCEKEETEKNARGDLEGIGKGESFAEWRWELRKDGETRTDNQLMGCSKEGDKAEKQWRQGTNREVENAEKVQQSRTYMNQKEEEPREYNCREQRRSRKVC